MRYGHPYMTKDLAIGVLSALLLLAVFQDYLLPSCLSVGYVPATRNTEGLVSGRAAAARGRRYVDYDIVVAYYNEPIDSMRDTINEVKERLPAGSKRTIIYYKGPDGREEELKGIADEVVVLKNLGREGETYLNHIVRHYPTGAIDFAQHTLFLQPHMAWDYVMRPRLSTVTHSTGFMSFGPYNNVTEGHTVQDLHFPRINDVYSMFRQELHPPYRLLSTWAGQFIVSRKRIMGNTFKSYENLLGYFHVEEDHWLMKEGWWNNQPSDPTFGHTLERSWPIIFGCTDAKMADECGDKSGGKMCECRD